MSPLEQYRALARYNRWMNRKVYALVGTLDEATQKRDLGAFFRSMHATLNHVLLADRAWMSRFTGDRERFVSRTPAGEPIAPTALSQELYADFELLHRERERTDEDILEWTYSVDEEQLDRVLEYVASTGDAYRHPMWWALGHMFNHATNHRAQVCTLLTQQGLDVGSTDLIAMLRDEEIPSR